ncbi:lipid carrier--UDP-N-acetylgalactosaminyltransferase [Rhodoplanes elegans]|uniref:Lipid carrier--UDP-N-acetylgalactosaminyltransferase n=1 Tax=Rhodoplanes elegans TaxID=29408 RepID=A0A327KQ07_9BRAD|nr:sugar transferase [Rhodoplanes elegans]MBK5959733.1 lipid carrier--UDP-N-acetylgalactosaminyltransferase [Rhodoplanes elegans]RAI39422.1 lipid carrier--UDP-N-acetylgalactosaminyltransferase [Rhodoplanes elegans]
MKRVFDLSAALAGLVVAGPIVAVCAALVRLGSQGPAIFKQVRVGRNERPFVCYKLRTMYVETKDAPSHETSASAITPLGRRLRHFKIDELPQLWNIVKGEMSFVGPRPCLPTQTALIEARRRRGLASLTPGITGVSQVDGIDMSTPEELAESDARYLADMSLGHDLRLIWRTVTGAGRGDVVKPRSAGR